MTNKNREWWEKNPMTYDWKSTNKLSKYSEKWFDEIDKRFIEGACLFTNKTKPFSEFIEFENIKGKKVLEIGCGMGLHTELLCRAGADVTAIDITTESITTTTKRLKLKGLTAKVMQADAETVTFCDNEFDFIWSWGVIHHTESTTKAIANAYRMLKPGCKFTFMVYNLNSSMAYIALAKHYFTGFWRGTSLEDALNKYTDGYTARYYTKDQLGDIMNMFSDEVTIQTCGQVSDAIVAPGMVRKVLEKFTSKRWMQKKSRENGFFLVVNSKKRI